jgi:eukaryotic-like serine/threonine-protein kinase
VSTDLRLSRQLSAGPDGLRYEGKNGAGTALVVERLFLARRHPARWDELASRLAVAARVAHPGVIQPLAAVLDGEDPYLVKPLHPTLRDHEDRTLDGTLSLVAALADALSAAHRMGLPHGALNPAAVALVEGRPAIDLTGTRTGTTGTSDDFDRVCTPPEARPATFPGDVFSLAALATSLLSGRASAEIADAEALAAESSTRRIGRLLAEMLDPDPGARPAMHEVVARLGRAETTEILEPESQALPPMTSRSRIGRYDLVDLVGEGGMGRVYRARDIGSGELVALKLLHERLIDNEQALKRFYREARVLAELDNDHIARFIEVNQDGFHHFLVMELIEGASLSALLERHGRVPVAFALAVVRDVARALADVHDLGVVHRDIKPGNVLLVGASADDELADASAYRVKLCDFGIVTATASDGDEELTRAGMALGTPHYMAPEQCIGADVGPAADVYALGITLYKLLAGVVPFNAPDARTIVYAHLRDPVPEIAVIAPTSTTRWCASSTACSRKLPTSAFPTLARSSRRSSTRGEAHRPAWPPT